MDNTYSFVCELTASTRVHTAGRVSTTIANRYVYDHMGSKLATFENINSQGEVVLNHLEYNEIGQMSSSNWLKGVGGLTGWDYEYDGNGNDTKDGLNSFYLTYNYLNLPATAIRATGHLLTCRILMMPLETSWPKSAMVR